MDHEKLFSGECANLPGFTYDRRWLISECIFDAKFQRMLRGNTYATKDKKDLGGDQFVYRSLQEPEHKKMSDEEFKAYCERIRGCS